MRLLGAVTVTRPGDRPTSPGGPRRRGLLAMVAAEVGRPVPVERLVDGLWYDPPASAVNVVQVQVSHLRRQLPRPVRLEWTGAGYLLDAPPGAVDLAVFEALANEATVAELQGLAPVAVERLRGALDLWTGEPLEGVGDLPVAEPLRRDLLERRGRVEDRLTDLLVEVDRTPEAVTLLEELVGRTPYDEHRWASLVRALGAVGRTADGLAAFQRARRVLVGDLGIEPGPELRGAEQQLLGANAGTLSAALGDPWATYRTLVGGLDPPGVTLVPPALEGLAAEPCVGREAPLGALRAFVGEARPAAGRVAVVVGEPGAGKTRLLAELSRRLAADGVASLYGRHGPERFVPYEAWGQALSAAVDQLPAGLTEALPRAVRGPLGRLTPAFVADGEDDPGPEPAGRFRLFESAAELLALLGEVTPIAVLLDDLQWADTGSVALTRAVLHRGLPANVRLIVASRPDPDDLDAGGLLGEMHDSGLAVDLPGLDAGAARVLLGNRGLDCTPADVERIVELSAGNPLVMQQFRTFDGSSFVEELRGFEPSARAGAMVNERLAGLEPDTVAVLEAASLAGFDFRLDEVVAVTGRSADEVILALEPAVGRGFVVESAAGDDLFGFGHALYQAVVQRRLSGPRRRRGHLALARHAAGTPRREVAAARHGFEAGSLLDPLELHALALAAADRLSAELAPDEELMVIERLRDDDRVAAALRDEQRFDLDLRRARLRCLCGDWDGSRARYLAVADEARAAGAFDVFTRAALEIDDWGRSVRLVGPRLGLLEEARRRYGDRGDEGTRIELDAAWAGEVNQFGRGDAAVASESLVAFAAELLERARALGRPEALAAALFTRHSVGYWEGDVEGNAAILREMIDIASTLGDTHRLHMGLLGLVRAALQTGDRGLAEEYLDRHAALAAATAHPRTNWLHLMQRSTLAQMDGRFDEADARALEMLAYGTDKAIPDSDGAFKAALYFNLFHAHRTAEVRGLVEEVVVAEPHNPLWRIGAGIAQAADGDVGAAQDSLDQVLNLIERIPRNEFWPSVLTMAADLADRVAPDAGRAASLEALLGRWSGRFVVMGSMITTVGPADRALGLLARQQGDDARADRLLDAADDLCARLGAVAWADRCAEARVAGRRR